MAETVSLQTLLTYLTLISIPVGVFYHIMTLRNTRKNQELTLETRQTQIFMQIFQHLNSEESLKSWAELVNQEITDYDEFLMKYDSSVNPAHYAKRANKWFAYNTIGELLQLGIIELDLLIRLKLDTQVIVMWEKWEEIIRAIRVRENVPDNWKGFEFLYDEMKKFRDTKGYPDITYPQPDHSS